MPKYPITTYPWSGEYQPRAEAVVELSKDALQVKMTAWEPSIVAAETRTGGAVCRDSCLEFFFMPTPVEDDRYINVECNCIGVMHIGVGSGRHGRAVLTDQPDGIEPVLSIVAGSKWSVRYDLPLVWIRSMFPGFDPGPGTIIKGNFYTCDETIHPHFGCAFDVVAEKPDFHRPECFGEIEL